MLNRVTITAAAMTCAAEILATHSEDAPDGALMADVERLSDLLELHAVQAGGSVPTEFVISIEPESPARAFARHSNAPSRA